MPLDKIFQYPGAANYPPDLLYAGGFAPIFSSEFFQESDSSPLGFSIYITGDVGSNTFINGNLQLSIGLDGYSNSNTISQLVLSDNNNIGNSILLTGISNILTSSFGDIYRNYSLVATDFSNSYSSGQSRNTLGFVGYVNTYTSSLNTNIRNNLSFVGGINSNTSETLNVNITRALNSISSSITKLQGDLNLQGLVSLAGLIASNSSSNNSLNILLLLNATIQTATILQNAGINANKILQATSSSATTALADIKRAISVGGNINSVTSAYSQAQVNILINGIFSSISKIDGTLVSQGQVNLNAIANVLSQVRGLVSVNLDFRATVLSNTFSVGTLEIAQAIGLAIQDAVRARTSLTGNIVKGISLDSQTSTDTDIVGSVNLNLSLGSVVGVLSALNGTLEDEVVLGTGEIIRLSVYLRMNREFSLDIQRSYNQSIALVGR